jgi:hypothetical protein
MKLRQPAMLAKATVENRMFSSSPHGWVYGVLQMTMWWAGLLQGYLIKISDKVFRFFALKKVNGFRPSIDFWILISAFIGGRRDSVTRTCYFANARLFIIYP